MNDKLIKYIKDNNIDVNRLANISGVPKEKLEEILSNSRKATINELGRLATKLHVTLDKVSNDEDIKNADIDNIFLKKREKRILGLSLSSFKIIFTIILITLVILSGTFLNRIYRIECSYKGSSFKEEIKYSLLTRDIRVYRIYEDDGNKYNMLFFDIHMKELNKKYHKSCTKRKIEGIGWKVGGRK